MIRFLFLAAGLLFVHPDVARGDPALAAIARGQGPASALSGLQVSLMRGGEAAGSIAFGFAQITADGAVPLRRDHKIRVASISKLVVAIGVLQLVEQGRLALDGDVSPVLGYSLRNPAFPDAPITPRQLLAHTSSIRDGSAYFIPAGEGHLRDFFTPGSALWEGGAHFASGREQSPGAYFTYANLNFGVLAALIERASGERFDRYMAQRVLEPLGVSARFDPCAVPEAQRAAAFRKREPGGDWAPSGPWVAQVDAGAARCFYGIERVTSPDAFLAAYRPGTNPTLFSPQGGLRASADDLIAVLRMLAGGGEIDDRRLLLPATVEAMLAANWTLAADGSNGASAGEAEPGGPTEGLMTSYGLSVHRIDMRAWGFASGPPLLLGHLGEAYGVLSHALFDPATDNGIATIITGTADDPAAAPPGSSPLYRVEEEILRWWLSSAHDVSLPQR